MVVPTIVPPNPDALELSIFTIALGFKAFNIPVGPTKTPASNKTVPPASISIVIPTTVFFIKALPPVSTVPALRNNVLSKATLPTTLKSLQLPSENLTKKGPTVASNLVSLSILQLSKVGRQTKKGDKSKVNSWNLQVT